MNLGENHFLARFQAMPRGVWVNVFAGLLTSDGLGGQGDAALWLTGRSGRLSSEATLDPSSTGNQAVTLARSDASAAEEASFIVNAASSLACKLRVRVGTFLCDPVDTGDAWVGFAMLRLFPRIPGREFKMVHCT